MESKLHEIEDVTLPKKSNAIEVKTLKVKSFEPVAVEIRSLGKFERLLNTLFYKVEKVFTPIVPIFNMTKEYLDKVVQTLNKEKAKVVENNHNKPQKTKGIRRLFGRISSLFSPKSKGGSLGDYNKSRELIKETKYKTATLKESELQTSLLQKILDTNSKSDSSNWLSTLLKGLFTSWVGKILTAIGVMTALLKLKSPLGGGSKKTTVAGKGGGKDKKGKFGKGKFGIGSIVKKLVVVGAVVSGISDYKEWKGVSEEHKTTLREKITGVIGGIANRFSKFVNFISLDTVDLFDKNKAFEVIDNITLNVEQSIESMLAEFPMVQASINVFTKGVNSLLSKAGDGLKNMYDWGEEFIRTQSKDEKNFVESTTKRKSIEKKYNEEQGLFESKKDYDSKRIILKKELDLAKKEELINAKKALDNKEFIKNSRFKHQAVLVWQKEQNILVEKDIKKYEEWSSEKETIKKLLKTSISQQSKDKTEMSKEGTTKERKETLSKRIDAYRISIKNLREKLNANEVKKPKVRKIKFSNLSDYSKDTSMMSLDYSKIDNMDINKNKINKLTGKKDGTLSWRNNNVGNLMSMYDGRINPVSGKKTKSKRNYQDALDAMKKKYEGVIAIDRYGSLVFETEEQGFEAQKKLLTSGHWKKKTISQAITTYAPPNDSNNTAKYIDSVSSSIGVDKSTKIQDLSASQFESLFQGIKKVEGYRKGTLIEKISEDSQNVLNVSSKNNRAKTTQKVVNATYSNPNLSEIQKPKIIKKDESKADENVKKVVTSEVAQGLNRIVQEIKNQNVHITNVAQQPVKIVAEKSKEPQPTSNIVFNTSIESHKVGV